MKNIISYYYHFANISLHYSDNIYTFEKNGSKYIFKEVLRPILDINSIYQLLSNINAKAFHSIIKNKDSSAVTIIDDKAYILLKINIENNNIIDTNNILNSFAVNADFKLYSKLYRINYPELWTQKVDYFEYQISHLEKKLKLLSASINYYIGLAENAISYAEDTLLKEQKTEKDYIVFSRIRIIKDMRVLDYYDPTNIVLDYRVRDVSEHLKQKFYDDDYTEEWLNHFLINLKYSSFGYRLLISRMLFPNTYFDMYEQVILGIIEEKKIEEIIKKNESYRDYLKIICSCINEIIEIPKIDWL